MSDQSHLDLDLGALDGPVLVFGGPYSNLQATEAVIAEAERLEIPPHNVICTGDVVAYCADAEATVQKIRDFGCSVVMGNCEESLGFDQEDCGCGFEEGSICDMLSARWYAHARSELTETSLAWMRELPRRIRFTLGDRKVVAIHGGADEINQFIFPSTSWSVKQHTASALGADIVLAGHSGLPFTQNDGRVLWVNAGVIGMPANDGTTRVCYSLLDQHLATVHALTYDYEAAAASMREKGLPELYAGALEDGLWADMAILPEFEQSKQGVPLNLS